MLSKARVNLGSTSKQLPYYRDSSKIEAIIKLKNYKQYLYQLSNEPPHHTDVRCMYMMKERRKVNLPCDFIWGLHGWMYIYAFDTYLHEDK